MNTKVRIKPNKLETTYYPSVRIGIVLRIDVVNIISICSICIC
jgi:hypothetical protein